jgi:hypothetical protein
MVAGYESETTNATTKLNTAAFRLDMDFQSLQGTRFPQMQFQGHVALMSKALL